MKYKNYLLSCILLFVWTSVAAATNSRAGWIFDHTAVEGALLIRFDPAVTSLPDVCAGSSSSWMAVRESNKAMMAVVLAAIATNNRNVTVYAKGIGDTGFCELVQVDPQG